MRKSIVSVLMIGLLTLGMLTGCGGGGSKEVTAESLLKDVQTKTEAMKSMENHITANITMDTGEENGGAMDMTMEMDMQTTNDPMANYTKATISVSGMSIDMEMYVMAEDDKLATYVGVMDQWMVEREDFATDDAEALDEMASDLLANLDKVTLAEETEEVDGKEAYIITGTIEGDDIQNVLGTTEALVGSMTGDGEMDMEGLSVDFKYAIGKEDSMPISVDYTFNGFDKLVDESGITISNFTMSMDYTAFDSVDAITVPQEVLDAAIEY